MKIPELKMGTAFSVATAVYIVCSLFGCVLYMLLPPFLSSVGARIHTYLLLVTAMEDSPGIWYITGTILAHLYILAMLVAGILALKTGKCKLFCLLHALEILMSLGFLVWKQSLTNAFTSGILLNMAYWLWLRAKAFPKSHPSFSESDAERNTSNGKL